ncbi:hypothetical protein GGR22_002602 [Flavobacterium gossypii]|uniref:Uncharacterized protein n=2 Tax=Flavobacterium TaxID=237 RepID=A0A495M1C2_9FLAO|nr:MULTISPECIES: hypothetical protein [Flavobacterium]MBA9074435.1 hypothetical protein [Flavobacterium gossypii]RKS19195.1 hypothetical protein CLV94_3146 [Flavobacterium endophyticum]WDO11461.1 hypothetical protein MH928_08970 [Flavobacterium sp. WW92]
MKSIASKLFFAAAIVMMSMTISCKEKPTETNVDVDIVDTTNVEPATTPAPDTMAVPTDTTKTPTP